MADIISLERIRRAQGQKAQAFGVLFESMFLSACKRQGVCITRMPDGCKQIGPKKVIRVKTAFDWILTHRGKTALIDTKTCQGATFPHSQIQDHQIVEMLHHEIAGACAGYVIWMRENDQILFLPASILAELMRVRGSIPSVHPKAIILGSSAQMDIAKIYGQEDLPDGAA